MYNPKKFAIYSIIQTFSPKTYSPNRIKRFTKVNERTEQFYFPSFEYLYQRM